MINLLIRNQMFSLKGNSTVTDDQENPRFLIEGSALSLRRKKTVCDLDGNLLYTIKNKLIRLLMNSCYVYDAQGKKVARIKQKLHLFKRQYSLTGYQDNIEIQGDIIEHCLRIYKNGEQIGEVGRKFLSLVDTFLLTCNNDEDAPLLVALVIAIDNIQDKNRRDR